MFSASLLARLRSSLDFSMVHPLRALLLTGLGAIVGLMIAGYALFTAKGTSTLVVPPEAVALVNQQSISRIDYLDMLQALGVDPKTASRARRRELLDEMIREELFVQRGKELDVAGVDPDVRNAMVVAVEQQAAASALTATPTEARLRDWYDRHRADYASEGVMAVRDLVFTLPSAQEAERALAQGQPADAVLARFKGRDSGKTSGEEFYFAAKIHLGDQLFAVARELAAGGASAPIPLQDGSHILVMAKNSPPTPVAFDDARAQVLGDFTKDAVNRFEKADERFLRKRANVLIAEDFR